MSVTFTTAPTAPDEAEVLAVLVAEGGATHPALDSDVLERLGFEGKAGSTRVLAGADGRLVAAAGLGPVADVDEDAVRKAGGALARALDRHTTVAV